MTDHPLTDEMMYKIHGNRPGYSNPYDDVDMRAAYDLAIEHYSKWIYENGDEYVIQHYEHNIKTDLETIVADFRKSMRPQQQENI